MEIAALLHELTRTSDIDRGDRQPLFRNHCPGQVLVQGWAGYCLQIGGRQVDRAVGSSVPEAVHSGGAEARAAGDGAGAEGTGVERV